MTCVFVICGLGCCHLLWTCDSIYHVLDCGRLWSLLWTSFILLCCSLLTIHVAALIFLTHIVATLHDASTVARFAEDFISIDIQHTTTQETAKVVAHAWKFM